MEAQLQGNICVCGEVWFTVEMPESEPSRCPFCGRILSDGELYDPKADGNSKFAEMGQQRDYSNDKSFRKATGKDKVELVSKICVFCTNEILFDVKDASRANLCPYCNDRLVPIEEYHNLITGIPEQGNPMPMDELEINQLIDQEVSILIKSWNPLKKPKVYIFKGLDYITMTLKLQDTTDKSFKWISFDNIKSISLNTTSEKKH